MGKINTEKKVLSTIEHETLAVGVGGFSSVASVYVICKGTVLFSWIGIKMSDSADIMYSYVIIYIYCLT